MSIREIDAIVERCKECGTATALAIRTWALSDDGEPMLTVHTERVEHTRGDCDQMRRLEREAWPTLW